jgi:hypothetical protein
METSPAESRILKKVIRTWIESEYSNLAKLNHLKQNIDDSTWKFAKRLNSELGRAVSLDFILEAIIETILILYPEYDAKERIRQELEDAERKRKDELEAAEQRKRRELEAIRQREEEETRHRREDILGGNVNRIKTIVRDCVCEFFGEEPGEEIDDEMFFNCFYINEFSNELNDAHELIEINMEIEAALEAALGTKIEFPDELAVGSTINEIAKAYGFYFKHGRYPKKSDLHGYVVAVSRLICQLEVDAKAFKAALPGLSSVLAENHWGDSLSIALYGSSSTNKQEIHSALVAFIIEYAPPWSGSMRPKTIERLINATQVLVDNPHYSNDYGYDEIASDAE